MPRLEKTQDVLRLAHEMQGTAVGVSLPDIMERFEVSRRTAERMRDAVCGVFPQVEEFALGDGLKRWRIPSRTGMAVVPVTADELATLHLAAESLRQNQRIEQAKVVDGVVAKLRAVLAPDVLRRIEIDYDSLVEFEGLALRPGPRLRIASEVMRDLRQAIVDNEQVRLHYRSRGNRAFSRLEVHPYGFLYGGRHYLVAFNPYVEVEDFRLFSLGDIERVERTGVNFERADFDLEAYARQSFGVFQEEPVDVVWRVSPEFAADAKDYLFHPTQSFEPQPDGSLVVRFTAGGILEMCWHLFTWGGAIQVVEPPELVTAMRRQLRQVRDALPPRRKANGANLSQEADVEQA